MMNASTDDASPATLRPSGRPRLKPPNAAQGAGFVGDDADPDTGVQKQAAPAQPARLLLVEDDRDVLLMLRGVLGEYGFVIHTAPSGRAGLAHCRQQPPDLVLLDIGIPPPDGFAVLKELKADARLWQVPVLLLTGRDDAASKAEAFRLGAHDYLTKPVEATELRARVARHLAMGQLTRGLLGLLRAYRTHFGPLDEQAPEPPGGERASAQVARLERARALIERHLAEPLSTAQLAAAVGLSQRALARGFPALFGTSTHGYLREARLQRAHRLLLDTDLLVKTIALEVGFRQTADLTRAMAARFGATPTALRAGAGRAARDGEV